MEPKDLPEGLYEQLITEARHRAIEQARARGLHVETEAVDGSLMRTLLLRQLRPLLDELLQQTDNAVSEANRWVSGIDADPVRAPATLLRAIHRTPERPPGTTTPLSVSALLTGASDEPRLGLELEREIASADEVDALVSFVTWEGWRRLQPSLEALARRGGRLRLITTTYTGATDAEAVAAIARLPGASVRVSYEGRRTRLHAKAWHFRRRSGFSTAWVGSANLSRAALSGGLEWTMKASAIDQPDILAKFAGTFETLWNDEEFERFEIDDEERLRAAIARERGGTATPTTAMTFFATLRPYPFQQDVLDRLAAERELHGRRRNLVVAATGTGKTLIAAFDYARLVPPSGLRPRLLFVAHRDELLQQSLEAFRHVLRDGAFGERLGAGYEPDSYDHLFTTVQSFASRRLASQFPPDHWDHVVIDECHHATADTYRELVEVLAPKVLVGLTATPERADGVDLLPAFDHHIAAEIRLWHALDKQLLAPFDYYGLSDETDLSSVEWKRGGYSVEGLEKVYTGNDRRAELVIDRFQHHRGNVAQARALGFCVSVDHAEFMARKFREAGIPAEAVHGDSPDTVRRAVKGRLERREINAVFTCDLYNEGVDLPFVDTLLLLRPTSSVTVYLQQLGRGLRLHEDKTSCLVLDFIGHGRAEFRFDRLLGAITGQPRGQLARAIEEGFPTLPSGCSIRLDAVARQVVLANVKQALRGGPRLLARELQEHARRVGRDISLARFLEDSGRPIEDVYEAGGFTALRVLAGLDPAPLDAAEESLAKRLKLLLHASDPEQLAEMRALSETGQAREDRRALMLGYQLWHERDDMFGASEVERRFAAVPRLRAELGAIASWLEGSVTLAPTATLPDGWTLGLHRAYERREILTAVGAWTSARKPPSREGVLRLGDTDELFFVTLVKEEKRFSPSTRYRDYAISRELFHWQSQSGTSLESPTGQAYVKNAKRYWLFVRRTDEAPFQFLGRARHVSHDGSRPISIVWKLDHAMPAALFQEFASLVAA